TLSPEISTESALQRLIECGYRFVHPRDDHGEIIAVIGIRVHGAVIDVIRLEGEDDVTALRVPGDEDNILEPQTVLWRSSGAVAAVIDDLLRLSDDDCGEQSLFAA